MVNASFFDGLLNKKIDVVMAMVLLVASTLIACNMEKIVENESQTKEKNQSKYANETIIIDPGHGGVDPGKIGVNKVLEKDINLEIGLKLEEILKESGFNVVITRSSDNGLYSAGSSNKKIEDMRARCQLINNTYASNPNSMVVSIHQNSFTSESVTGAQVFYYAKSENAKEYAAIMQNILNTEINVNKPKQAKENTNYYMLLHTNCPAIIVECGFLSNWEEAQNLATADYQERVAKVIYEGIIKCVESKK